MLPERCPTNRQLWVLKSWNRFPLPSKTVVLNLGSIETLKFGESASGVRRFWKYEEEKKAHFIFFQLRRDRWMYVWNLWGSVPPTRLRTTALKRHELVEYKTKAEVNIFHLRSFFNFYLTIAFSKRSHPWGVASIHLLWSWHHPVKHFAMGSNTIIVTRKLRKIYYSLHWEPTGWEPGHAKELHLNYKAQAEFTNGMSCETALLSSRSRIGGKLPVRPPLVILLFRLVHHENDDALFSRVVIWTFHMFCHTQPTSSIRTWRSSCKMSSPPPSPSRGPAQRGSKTFSCKWL